MSNPTLPAELLDDIADHLDTTCVLRSCCLVSKSWIPRTRKHLFATIEFHTAADLELWKQTFPDPSTSPACYTKTLIIGCPQSAIAADSETGGWIRGFSRVEHWEVENYSEAAILTAPFVPFHGFSPFIKSIYLGLKFLPSSQVFNLILSFPLLQDLSLWSYDASTDDGDSPDVLSTISQPSIPPTFTGSLYLYLSDGGLSLITHRLLSLPAGIHFREFSSTWFHPEDPLLAMAVVEKCSRTVETLDITCHLLQVRPIAIDLSKATKLKNLVFRLISRSVEWITMAFRTTVPELPELRQISIHLPFALTTFNVKGTGPGVHGEWLDLDRLLVQFWESCYSPPMVICTAPFGEEEDMRDFVEYLLPELTKRGTFDPVGSGTGTGLRIGKFNAGTQLISAEFGHRNLFATIT